MVLFGRLLGTRRGFPDQVFRLLLKAHVALHLTRSPTAGSPEKRALARTLGAEEAFDSKDPGWVKAVRAISQSPAPPETTEEIIKLALSPR